MKRRNTKKARRFLIGFLMFLVSGMLAVNAQSNFSKQSGEKLIMSYKVPEKWLKICVLCKKPIPLESSSNVGMWIRPGKGYIKPHVLFRDNEGEIFIGLWRVNISDYNKPGEYGVETSKSVSPAGDDIKKALNGETGNGKLDLPVSLVGLFFYNREVVPQEVLVIDNITSEGKLVEGFENNDRGWFISNVGDNSYCGLKATLAGKPLEIE